MLLGVSGVLSLVYKSSIAALKDKLGVSEPQLNTLLMLLHHIAVASLSSIIWDQIEVGHDDQ
jgi:hypothetical protein